MFTDYVDKLPINNIFFDKNVADNKKKIKAFKRMCFVIYSGEKDQYADKLTPLIEQVVEVMRNSEKAHPSLLILIFFLFRILIIRLSHANLKSLFLNFWPPLVSLFINIFGSVSDYKAQKE